MNLQVEFHVLVESHDRSLVPAAIAVVRRTKHCDDVAVVRPIVALHDELVSTCDSRQAVRVIKLFGYILTETVASTSGRDTPSASVIGVRPEQIAHGTLLGHLLNSIKLSNLV